MRKVFLFLLCAVVLFSFPACLKSNSPDACTNVPVAEDEARILSYLSQNGITGYVKHSSGLYYKIENPGSGVVPNLNSTVYVKYNGKFVTNTSFDSETDASKTGWPLKTLIQGWQIGIPLISKGGVIKLFVPSALGYGCQTVGPIPANSVLVFDVELVDLQ